MRDYDQRIVEASDIALALWLLRDTLWRDLPSHVRGAILGWMAQINRKAIPDNNWHLIVVFTNLVLADLGHPIDRDTVLRHYARFKSFEKGSGWFSDGPAGPCDYYNAWQMYFLLFWITKVAPDFDSDFIRSRVRQFLTTFKYLIPKEGIPIFGRSICYRMAAVTPHVIGTVLAPDIISPGLGRRALGAVWKHFLARGAVERGTIVQGYYKKDLRLVENYSGPASALLCLRGVTVALSFGTDSPFWYGPEELLPIEVSDYRIGISQIGVEIEGRKDEGEVVLRLLQASPYGNRRITRYSIWRKLLGWFFQRPFRPDNYAAKYGRDFYSSLRPFMQPRC
jgi:hypothetical protein